MVCSLCLEAKRINDLTLYNNLTVIVFPFANTHCQKIYIEIIYKLTPFFSFSNLRIKNVIVNIFYNNCHGRLALESSGKLPFALFEAGIKLVRANLRLELMNWKVIFKMKLVLCSIFINSRKSFLLKKTARKVFLVTAGNENLFC